MVYPKRQLSIEELKKKISNVQNLGDVTSDFCVEKIITIQLIKELANNINSALEISMEKDELIGSSWMVLIMIYSSENQQIIATDICQMLGQNKSTTSRIVESLITKRFLERKNDTIDRRKVYLTITKEGKNYVKGRLPKHNNYHNKILKGVNLSVLLPEINKILLNSHNLNLE